MEIGGDTTKLTAALKGVNGEIRTTQSQLRDVNNLLKLDPGNTELLAQKHRLLAEAVRETKEKLETLKAAAEQANEALAKGEITQEQYDGLQREIIETEERLKSLEEQANQSAVAVQKIAAVGEDLKNLGDKISGVGTTLTKTVTTPIVGLGTVAVKTAADFDSAMSQVGAVSGATGSELEALRDKAREMGAKTKFSASEAAEAMNYMAMAGWKTSDIKKSVTIRQVSADVNKLVIYDAENYANTRIYYLHPDLGYDTKDRDRIVPVVCEMQSVSHEEGSSFESAAISAAHNKFANLSYSNLIELTMMNGDALVKPEELEFGQVADIISDGESYRSILTGRERGKNTKLVFGTVRLDLTKILRRQENG